MQCLAMRRREVEITVPNKTCNDICKTLMHCNSKSCHAFCSMSLLLITSYETQIMYYCGNFKYKKGCLWIFLNIIHIYPNLSLSSHSVSFNKWNTHRIAVILFSFVWYSLIIGPVSDTCPVNLIHITRLLSAQVCTWRE